VSGAQADDGPFEVWAALCGFDLPDIRRRIDAAPRDDRERLLRLLEQAKASASARVGKDGKSFATAGAVAMLSVVAKDLELLPKARRDNRRQAGTRKPRKVVAPAWHSQAIRHAKTLLAAGREVHELTGLCARKFGRSDDAVRAVLQSANLIPRRKNRAQ